MSDLKAFVTLRMALDALVFSFYYFFIMPDEVFEIKIDPGVEKLNTIYYPKLGSRGQYNIICCISL